MGFSEPAITDPANPGHTSDVTVMPVGLAEVVPSPMAHTLPAAWTNASAAHPPLTFDVVYDECVDFVWRSLKSLGVRDLALDDAVQDVFLVVHRRLAEFEHRSAIQSWVFGIALRVARDVRRREARKGGLAPLDFEVVDHSPGPHEDAANAETLREVAMVLQALDENKRAVFILAEIEQWTAQEIAQTLGANVNTVYARIRAARREFDAAFHRRKDEPA